MVSIAPGISTVYKIMVPAVALSSSQASRIQCLLSFGTTAYTHTSGMSCFLHDFGLFGYDEMLQSTS